MSLRVAIVVNTLIGICLFFAGLVDVLFGIKILILVALLMIQYFFTIDTSRSDPEGNRLNNNVDGGYTSFSRNRQSKR